MWYLVGAGYVVVGTCVRVSSFINLTLCVVRSLNILQPFYRVKRFHTACPVALYAVFWCLVSLYDVIWFQKNVGLFQSGVYAMRALVLKPEVGYAGVKGLELSVGGDIVVLFGLPFVVPVAILTVSTIIQVRARVLLQLNIRIY